MQHFVGGWQRPLCHVLGWWSAVWGPVGVPRNGSLWWAPEHVAGGVRLRWWWRQDHLALWVFGDGVSTWCVCLQEMPLKRSKGCFWAPWQGLATMDLDWCKPCIIPSELLFLASEDQHICAVASSLFSPFRVWCKCLHNVDWDGMELTIWFKNKWSRNMCLRQGSKFHEIQQFR